MITVICKFLNSVLNIYLRIAHSVFFMFFFIHAHQITKKFF